jgi:hypothetical protein
MAVVGNRRIRDKAGSKNYRGTARGDDFQISKAQKQLDAINAKINKRGDKGKYMPFENQKSRLEAKIRDLRGVAKMDLKKNPLKISNRGMTPARTLAKGESKISRANINRSMPGDAGNPQPKKKKARRNAAGTMGQMAYGGKVKKMMGGGMAKKTYKHGGSVKKCKIDGLARKGKTRAARKK